MNESIQYIVVSKRRSCRTPRAVYIYDIIAYDMSSHTVVARARNVTVSREKALCMMNAFNRCRLSPVHLADVIDDLLRA